MTPSQRLAWLGTRTRGVYVVSDGEFVKIGCTTNMAYRMKALQVSYPRTLYLLCMLSDNPDDESKFHCRFTAHRIRGEWFRNEGDLAETIDYVVRGGDRAALLDDTAAWLRERMVAR